MEPLKKGGAGQFDLPRSSISMQSVTVRSDQLGLFGRVYCYLFGLRARNADLAWAICFRNGRPDVQDSVFVGGLYMVGIDRLGEHDTALKRAVAEFAHQPVAILLLVFDRLELTFDRQHVLLHGQLNLLWLNTWQQRRYLVALLGLEHIHRHSPGQRPGRITGTHKTLRQKLLHRISQAQRFAKWIVQ